MIRIVLCIVLSLCAATASADGTLFRVPTREGITTTVFWEATPGASATVLLFPGGGGGFGQVENGKPTGRNFLVRSEAEFVAQGFNVAIFGRPSDSQDLDYADRIAEPHMTDVARMLAFVREQSPLPVWLVGTSRGTVSATAAAIRHGDQIAGLVLSSSVVSSKKPGAVPTQNLAAVTMPTLVLHHSKDACPVCDPGLVPAILRGLTNARVKKLVMVSGGDNPTGNVCEALHWHGYIGMEREAVGVIGAWIKAPGN
ncbi:hypothetical protein GCM10025771_08750 [Niveibacterium umoris]|uniref:Pimeloyl-ACP methyl ester carboxylesterase n=1 Tax=Niveibacterium umoris TaxID=1193620 RepID=A0A840BRX7_9RHOO|nr:alpha/beta hydrolase [Niveibacterium umoris]MBB4013576.1 pimeloyl-ACP methyl ester carboxylesterase [Niveibacterium umoris]